MTKIRIEKTAKGAYSRHGKRGGNTYLAEIRGLDPEYGFERDFLATDEVDWSNYNNRTRKGYWVEEYEVGRGVYEVQEYGERRYIRVFADGRSKEITRDEAKELFTFAGTPKEPVNVMARAHEIARTLEGDYRARMSMALRQAWAETR